MFGGDVWFGTKCDAPQSMKRNKEKELPPTPRSVIVVAVVLAVFFVGLVLMSGNLYLANWRGEMAYVPFVLLVGGLLVFILILGSATFILEKIARRIQSSRARRKRRA